MGISLAANNRSTGRQSGFAKTIVKTSFTNLLILLLTTATSILTARMMGVVGKGELTAVLFWPVLLGSLLSFGFPTSFIYWVKKQAATAPELLGLALAVQLPVCLLTGAVAWLLLPTWLGHYSPAVIQLAQVYTAVAIPLTCLTGMATAIAQSLDRFHVYNGILLHVPAFNLAGLALMWLSGLLTVPVAVMVSGVASLLAVGWAFYRMRGEIGGNVFRLNEGRTVRRAFYTYGAKVYGMELMGTLSTQTDKIVIVSLLSPRELGLYSVVYALSRVFNVVQNAVTNVVFPKVTGLEPERIVETVSRSFRISMLLMLVALLPGLIVGRFMLGLLFGPDFLAADTTFYALSVECIVGGGSWILASSFNALGRPGLVLFRQIAAFLATFGLFFVFAPSFGLLGIALAMLVGAIVRLAFSVAAFPLLFRMPVRRVLFDRSDYAFVLEAVKGKRHMKDRGVGLHASDD